MNLSRKSLIGTFALVATLSAPLAFAQSDTSSTEPSPPPTTSNEASMQSPPPTTSNDAAAATTSGDPAKKSWADIDLDKDGKLSKTEAAAVPALVQVFDQADSNADGSLTSDEYKAHVAKSMEGKKQY
jgi:hypothetical protein